MPPLDWRSGTGYDEAVGGGWRGMAWEFLRRNLNDRDRNHPDDVTGIGDGNDGQPSDDRVVPWGLRFRR